MPNIDHDKEARLLVDRDSYERLRAAAKRNGRTIKGEFRHLVRRLPAGDRRPGPLRQDLEADQAAAS